MVKKFGNLDELLGGIPKNEKILNAYIKLWNLLNRKGYKNILCSVSGGQDSDVMLDMCYRCDLSGKVHYVFFDTGIEYEATKRHLDELEKVYDITIERERALVPVPLAVKKYGVPFLSKDISEKIYWLQKHNFGFDDKTYIEHMQECTYPRYALGWFDNYNYGKHERTIYMIDRLPYLREYMIEHKPNFLISSKCCSYAKKDTSKKYEKEHDIDLVMMGIRKAEGGQRASAYESCFYEQRASHKSALFMPIFWFKSEEVELYKNFFDLWCSDCYIVYGFKRTGCACCPYAGKKVFEELEVIKKYEPKLYKAVTKIFGESYEYFKGYLDYKEERKKDNLRSKETEKKKKNYRCD